MLQPNSIFAGLNFVLHTQEFAKFRDHKISYDTEVLVEIKKFERLFVHTLSKSRNFRFEEEFEKNGRKVMKFKLLSETG